MGAYGKEDILKISNRMPNRKYFLQSKQRVIRYLLEDLTAYRGFDQFIEHVISRYKRKRVTNIKMYKINPKIEMVLSSKFNTMEKKYIDGIC